MPTREKRKKVMSTKAAFAELKKNPPAILAKTRKKKGAAAANRQRVAIGLSKAGLSKKKSKK